MDRPQAQFLPLTYSNNLSSKWIRSRIWRLNRKLKLNWQPHSSRPSWKTDALWKHRWSAQCAKTPQIPVTREAPTHAQRWIKEHFQWRRTKLPMDRPRLFSESRTVECKPPGMVSAPPTATKGLQATVLNSLLKMQRKSKKTKHCQS